MERRKHVLLTPEAMSKDLIGMEVTMDIRSEGGSRSGEISKYDEKNIHIKISGKVHKLPYDPANIILKVYQFGKRVKFCCQSELDAIENKKTDSETEEVESTTQTLKQPEPTKKKGSAVSKIKW